MDNQTKGAEEGGTGDEKELVVSVSEQETPSDRVTPAKSVANQEVGASEIDIRPNVEPKSSDDTVNQRSTSATTSTSMESARAPQDGSLPPKKPKKDRSNLRKGKWTVEEEEYTSRIIHYFGAGLLTLPEGATLRSYLADKLNCDPMRITKKYAGASCLGRRVHQFRDRPNPTVAEIQLAKAELDHLEQRFRMRVEEGFSSMPMNPQPDIMFSLAQQANQFLMKSMATPPPPLPAAPQNVLPPWLFGMNAQPPAPPAPAGIPQAANGLAEQAKALSSLANLGAVLPWLLPNTTANAPAPFPTPPPNSGAPNAQTMASWAFAQAAASLAPAITQLAAANLQQQCQLQQQPPKPAPPVPPADPMKELSARLLESRDAESLRQALQAALAATSSSATTTAPSISQTPSNVASSLAPPAPAPIRPQIPTGRLNNQRPGVHTPQGQHPVTPRQVPAVVPPTRPPAAAPTNETAKRPRSDEDRKDGDILLGFLSSLRQSYEEALKEKDNTETPASQQQDQKATPRPPVTLQVAVGRGAQRPRFAQVSDTSSGGGPPESSLEESDWHFDKKTETSSSEDSDKEVNGSSSKGPPRKRLKTKRAADERQRESTANRN